MAAQVRIASPIPAGSFLRLDNRAGSPLSTFAGFGQGSFTGGDGKEDVLVLDADVTAGSIVLVVPQPVILDQANAFVPPDKPLSLIGTNGETFRSGVVDMLGAGVGQPPRALEPGREAEEWEAIVTLGAALAAVAGTSLHVALQGALDSGLAGGYKPTGPWIDIHAKDVTLADALAGKVVFKAPWKVAGDRNRPDDKVQTDKPEAPAKPNEPPKNQGITPGLPVPPAAVTTPLPPVSANPVGVAPAPTPGAPPAVVAPAKFPPGVVPRFLSLLFSPQLVGVTPNGSFTDGSIASAVMVRVREARPLAFLPVVRTITPGYGFTVATAADDKTLYHYLRIA
jgi:hypothetical protein